MTSLERFLSERAKIQSSLESAGLATIQFNKDDIPRALPAAIITLTQENGRNGTSRRYVDTDLFFTVFLVVNAQNVLDPDTALYTLKEAFRSAWQTAAGKDFHQIDYYTSRLDGSRLVRIAKIDLTKPTLAGGPA